jgi:hypothetical protein
MKDERKAQLYFFSHLILQNSGFFFVRDVVNLVCKNACTIELCGNDF